MSTTKPTEATVITAETLLDHWQSHRRLTRKVIDAFPEDKLYEHSIGGMRPFAEMAMELAGLAAGGIRGVVTGEWRLDEELDYHAMPAPPRPKQEILRLWDLATERIDTLWPQIPPARFQEVDTAWGMYEGTIWSHILYFIDNEVHHRGQGYVYLRDLGIEPPYFWDVD